MRLDDLRRDCRRCKTKGREGECVYEIPGQESWEINGVEYSGCPYRIVTREGLLFIRAYQFFKQGYLPCGGGWLDQAAKLLDAFQVIERELAKVEEERSENIEKIKRLARR